MILPPPNSLNNSELGPQIEIKANIEQESRSRADESGFADGDRIGVFVVNYIDGKPGALALSGNQANNVAFTFHADNNRWTSATNVYWLDKKTPADVIGYYPFDNSLPDVDAYPFEVAVDQSIPASDGEISTYEASDFLQAKAATVTPGEPVNLAFQHRLAGVKVILEPGEGFSPTEWAKLEKTVTVDNTSRSCLIDLSSGAVTVSGAFDRHITMNPEAEDGWRAVVVPQTVENGKSVIGITIDGVSCNFVREGGMSYAPGKLHKFTLKVTKPDGSGAYAVNLVGEEITPWEADLTSHDFEANTYVVVNCPEAGKLRESIIAVGSDPTTVQNLKVTGVIDPEDFRFMREGMPAMRSLNLKEVKVVRALEKVVNDQVVEGEYVDDAIPAWGLDNMQNLRRLVLPDNITRIGTYGVAHLRLTSTLIIPESVTVIDDWAFSDNAGETGDIVLPHSLEYIGGCAFFDNKMRMEFNLSSTLRYIGSSAFWGCSNAFGVFSLPPKLEYIGEDAFKGCGEGKGGLTGDIVIPEAIIEIQPLGISLPNGTNLILHEGVKLISDEAFAGMKFNSPIVFPKSLEYIGKAAFIWCKFVGEIHFPENIKYIGNSAFSASGFSGNFKFPENINVVLCPHSHPLMGEGSWSKTKITGLEIGDNVLQIEAEAFSHNEMLRTVEIGKNVNFIGERAFMNCPALEKFVIHSKEPPRTYYNTFEYIFFDKVVLEVPEGCVDKYRNAEGWKRFQNITEHHELAFNIPDIACLDRGVTRTGILRAEGPWRVSECPSWVHVTPSQGDYKDEITVTVDAQAASAGEREGKIVFTLNNKNYTAYTTVRQLAPPEAGEDKEIILQTASAGAPKEVPLFIVGEGFTADQIVKGEYLDRMRRTMELFFAIEPYKSMRDYFTVSTAIACSPDEGTGDVETIKMNCFDTDGVSPNVDKLREYVKRVSPAHVGNNLSNSLIIVVSNYKAFSGWSSIESDGLRIAGIGIVDDVYPYDQRGLVQHFAGGKAFAGLGNESVSHFHHIKGCICSQCAAIGEFGMMKAAGYFANLSMSSKMNDAPWRDFIFHPKYSGEVDMWEGGYNHSRGVWRSEANSVMNTYIAYFNTISRYTIYQGIMRCAGLTPTLEDFIAKDKIEKPQ